MNYPAAKVRRLLTSEFRLSPWRTAMTARPGRAVVVGRGFRVVGADHIATHGGRLDLGTLFYGFADPRMGGLLRVRGRLNTEGVVQVAHGNRWDVGPEGTLTIGAGSYFSPGSRIVAMNSIRLGAGCAVAWDCQFLDEDFHDLRIDGQLRGRSAGITLGDRVWVGTRSMILKGTTVADGCVIAAGSVVSGQFPEPNSLIAGVPARVIRSGVEW